jgi:hypothetical protein
LIWAIFLSKSQFFKEGGLRKPVKFSFLIVYKSKNLNLIVLVKTTAFLPILGNSNAENNTIIGYGYQEFNDDVLICFG